MDWDEVSVMYFLLEDCSRMSCENGERVRISEAALFKAFTLIPAAVSDGDGFAQDAS